MREITNVTKFMGRTNQSDHIKIIDKGSYYALVGSQGGVQELSVTIDYRYPNPVAEENNSNFKRLEAGVICFGPHDPESIMHYSLGRYSCGQELQARSGTKGELVSGQREKLSKVDIRALNKLYPKKRETTSVMKSATFQGNSPRHLFYL
ncbi:hypothetical protein RclHR1_01890014 [Rhizophagus clarus]|nr:hypothetical protein RclHR1_01890014 [Rhizophagus clarus]